MAKVTLQDRADVRADRAFTVLRLPQIEALGKLGRLSEDIPQDVVDLLDHCGIRMDGDSWAALIATCQYDRQQLKGASRDEIRAMALSHYRARAFAQDHDLRTLVEWTHPEAGIVYSPQICWAGQAPVVQYGDQLWTVPTKSLITAEVGDSYILVAEGWPMGSMSLLDDTGPGPQAEAQPHEYPPDPCGVCSKVGCEECAPELGLEGAEDVDGAYEAWVAEQEAQAEYQERYGDADSQARDCPDCGKWLAWDEAQDHGETCPGPQPQPDHYKALELIGQALAPSTAVADYEARVEAFGIVASQLGWASWDEVEQGVAYYDEAAQARDEVAQGMRAMIGDEPQPWAGREKEARDYLDQALDWLEHSQAGGVDATKARDKAARWIRLALGYMPQPQPEAPEPPEPQDRVASLPLELATELKCLEVSFRELREIFLIKASQPDLFSQREAMGVAGLVREARNKARLWLTEYGWGLLGEAMGDVEYPPTYQDEPEPEVLPY